jgi:hypothetical protein
MAISCSEEELVEERDQTSREREVTRGILDKPIASSSVSFYDAQDLFGHVDVPYQNGTSREEHDEIKNSIIEFLLKNNILGNGSSVVKRIRNTLSKNLTENEWYELEDSRDYWVEVFAKELRGSAQQRALINFMHMKGVYSDHSLQDNYASFQRAHLGGAGEYFGLNHRRAPTLTDMINIGVNGGEEDARSRYALHLAVSDSPKKFSERDKRRIAFYEQIMDSHT